MAIVLTTPIVIKNLSRWRVTKFVNRQDEDPPFAEVEVQILGADGTVYWTGRLAVYDALPSSVLLVNPNSVGYGDKVIGGSSIKAGAYSALVAADNAATGGRAAHLNAVALACLASDICGPGLAGTAT